MTEDIAHARDSAGTALADLIARIGDQRIPFGPQDVLVAPNWTWRGFEASEDCFLFCSSERAALEPLGLYREERAPA